MIYLDNAATTLHKPQPVIDAVVAALQHMGNAGRGATSGALDAGRCLHYCRLALATLLGCPDPAHVCFAPNSTAALNTVLNGLIRPGDQVVTTDLEHNSVLRPLARLAKTQNVQVSYAKADALGNLDMADLAQKITPQTALVVTTHASNLTGNVVDIAAVAKLAHAAGATYVVDASQTAGVLPINIAEQNVDVVCFTGHKGLLGPQGTGGCAVNTLRDGKPLELDILPWCVGGTGIQSFNEEQPLSWPVRLEAGTQNAHGAAGLLAALDWIQAQGGSQAIYQHEHKLAQELYEGLSDLPNITFYGDYAAPIRAGIVTFNIGSVDSAEVSDALMQGWGIATRPGGHCAPRMHQHFGTVSQGAIRMSVGWSTTHEEIQTALAAVSELAREFE